MAVVFDRLTPFESFMYTSHQPHQPMTLYARLVFDETCDLGRLEESLNHTIARHPLLNARVVRKGVYPCWETIPWEPVKITPTTQRELLNTSPLDITQGRGFRAWVITKPEVTSQTEIILEIHHSCVDGLAALQLIKEWRETDRKLVQSKSNVSEKPPELTKAELKKIRSRGEEKLGWMSKHQLKRIIRFYLAKKVLHLKNQDQKSQYNRKAVFCQISDVVNRLSVRPPIEGLNWTLNDILLSAAYLSIFQLSDPDSTTENSRFRIGVPANTRYLSKEPDLVANCVTMTFIDQLYRQEIDDDFRRDFFRTMVQETNSIKKHHLFLSMLHTLRAIYPWHWIPGSICASSMVLSNVGRIAPMFGEDFSWNDQNLTSISLVPPIRETSNLAIAIVGMNSDLHLGVLYNGDFLSESYIQQFLQSFKHEANRLIDLMTPGSP
ncbi:MAG TPA: hypothetical protein DIW81_02055 [Planctomycetaceae bacterium]|nr:hypothetical protein [Rubinisphaera sp.]HCS50368.1 hypothetical protein [Planctomycetaceae bacterium]|tara:strand:- start:20107 stop:21417 length:1311 start_codon:yes stop_codon:yes gene_type:complete